jgi:hypothetical protein
MSLTALGLRLDADPRAPQPDSGQLHVQLVRQAPGRKRGAFHRVGRWIEYHRHRQVRWRNPCVGRPRIKAASQAVHEDAVRTEPRHHIRRRQTGELAERAEP